MPRDAVIAYDVRTLKISVTNRKASSRSLIVSSDVDESFVVVLMLLLSFYVAFSNPEIGKFLVC